MGSHIVKFKAHASQIGGTVKPSLMLWGVGPPCVPRRGSASLLPASALPASAGFALMRGGVVSPGFFFFVQRHPSQSLGAC